MAYKEMRSCLTAFIIKEMQIKTAKCHFNLNGQIHDAGEFVGKET